MNPFVSQNPGYSPAHHVHQGALQNLIPVRRLVQCLPPLPPPLRLVAGCPMLYDLLLSVVVNRPNEVYLQASDHPANPADIAIALPALPSPTAFSHTPSRACPCYYGFRTPARARRCPLGLCARALQLSRSCQTVHSGRYCAVSRQPSLIAPHQYGMSVTPRPASTRHSLIRLSHVATSPPQPPPPPVTADPATPGRTYLSQTTQRLLPSLYAFAHVLPSILPIPTCFLVASYFPPRFMLCYALPYCPVHDPTVTLPLRTSYIFPREAPTRLSTLVLCSAAPRAPPLVWCPIPPCASLLDPCAALPPIIFLYLWAASP